MTTIHLTRSGQGSPLLLCHGWGFDSRIWQSILPMLTQYYEVYCVDLPGFGLSATMDWPSFKKNLLERLPESFAIAGWSLGGMVATRLALEAPNRVSHMINIASSPCFIEDLPWPGVPKAVFTVFSERLTNDPEAVLGEFMALQLRGQTAESFASTTQVGLQMGLDWLLNWDLRSELSSIQVPALYIFGRLDAIVPRSLLPVMQQMYPQFEYVMINKAAHALFLSHQSAFISALTDFISSK